MKRNTTYFTIGCIALVFLVGIFIYIIAATTYSVNDISNVTINDVSVPVNGTKSINVSFEYLNNAMTTEEVSKYHLEWDVNSNNVSLGSSTTTLGNANNSVTALSLDNDVIVTVSLYYDDDENPIASDTASVNIFSVDNVTFTNVLDPMSFTVYLSDSSVTMQLPSGYNSDTYHFGWSSSDENVLTVNSSGVVTPITIGISTVTANVYDDENNVVAIASQPILVVAGNSNIPGTNTTNNSGNNSNIGADNISGEGEEDDYVLKSISVNGGANIIDGNKKDYIVTVSNESTFKINAVAKNGGTVKIKNDEDGKTYNNNQAISWKVGSPNMVIYICVVGTNNECLSDDYVYQIVLEKSGSSTIDSEGYLESLSIDSDKIIEDGVVLANYSVDCDDSGDMVLCVVKYTAKAGTQEVNINAKAKSRYEISTPISNPMVVSVGENGETISIIEAGDTSKVVRCLYEIDVIVPEGTGDSKPAVTTDDSHNAGSNPGTADMSSFVIFMVMMASLVASLFVYKKNVGNN